jgi:hypothetical protein
MENTGISRPSFLKFNKKRRNFQGEGLNSKEIPQGRLKKQHGNSMGCLPIFNKKCGNSRHQDKNHRWNFQGMSRNSLKIFGNSMG